MIDDRRTPEEVARTVWLVVATDSFMSGWGMAKNGSSYFAIPCESENQVETVKQNMLDRKEMKRVRIVDAKSYRPKLKSIDHLSIRSLNESSHWFQPGAFRKPADPQQGVVAS